MASNIHVLHSSLRHNPALAASSTTPPAGTAGSHTPGGPLSPHEAAESTRSRDSLPGPDYESHKQNANMDKSTIPQYQQQQSLAPPPLSFYQRYFTKPDEFDSDQEKNTDSRHFSFLSVGSILSAVLAMLVSVGIIASTVALSVNHVPAADAAPARVEAPARDEAPIRLAIRSNFPDPSLWYENGTYYAFATTNAAGVLHYSDQKFSNASKYTVDFGLANVQMATSKNFVDWTVAPLDAQPLSSQGKWTQAPNATKLDLQKISSTWAPAITRRADGKFVMYYSAAPGFKVEYKVNHPHPHCIGAAVSTGDSPAGPYEPLPEFLVCPWEQGGAIDPEVFRDPKSGKLYIVYKIDGNNIGSGGACGNTFAPIKKTPLMLQEMKEDGVTKVGEPIQILTNEAQDGPLIEAPDLVQSKDGIYFLFFSSGCTRLSTYALEYATATNIMGPYKRAGDKLLKTGDWGLEAPGSVGISEDGKGGWSMAFHARVNDGNIGRVRAMFTTKLKFKGRTVSLERDDGAVDLRRKHHGD